MKREPISTNVIGIDEAGRGPLAGPVAVGMVAIPANFDWSLIPHAFTDSKKMSEHAREEVFCCMQTLRSAKVLRWRVALIGPHIIERDGITAAIRQGIGRVLARESRRSSVLLDGGLRAPRTFTNQTTVIKGDLLHPEISLASIMAKVTRDRYMRRLHKKFPQYGFDRHKGYGTQSHREAIKHFGMTDMHRQSWIKE